ncbi:MAG: hypothetical protein F4014_11065 [Gemmatimonadetes bacterium]|nr:hypothetical protein [Gemmatimonadota bacterium]
MNHADDDRAAITGPVVATYADDNRFVIGGELFTYDSDDTFLIGSKAIETIEDFEKELEGLVSGDTIDVLLYDDDDISIFRITKGT